MRKASAGTACFVRAALLSGTAVVAFHAPAALAQDEAEPEEQTTAPADGVTSASHLR